MLIYIAGPYEGILYAKPLMCTGISTELRTALIEGNVQAAIRVADTVIRLGCVPFVPHLWHEMNKTFKHTRQAWIKLGLQALRHCQAVIRLPGMSEGVQEEIALARLLGIPVFASDDLLSFAEFIRQQKGAAIENRDQEAGRFKRFVRDLQSIPIPHIKESHSER